MENRTGILTNGIIWFGVAISVSEIEAGIQIGTLSSLNSLWFPLILGHLLGGIMLFLVGYIGASVRKNAMETTESAFGRYGSKFCLIECFAAGCMDSCIECSGGIGFSRIRFPNFISINLYAICNIYSPLGLCGASTFIESYGNCDDGSYNTACNIDCQIIWI